MIDQRGDLTTLVVHQAGGVVRCTINRPQARNSLTAEVMADFDRLFTCLEGDPGARVLILDGAGGTFCAGGDISAFALANVPPPAPPAPDPLALNNREFGDLLLRLSALPQVTIALVEGAAIGGGMGLVSVADIAYAVESAKFGLGETRLGLVPAQIAPFLVTRMGVATTRRAALTGATWRGQDALAARLVDAVFPDRTAMDAAADQVIADVLRCGPAANAATKELLAKIGTEPIADVLDEASRLFAVALRGDEAREGTAAFLSKRAPAWAPQSPPSQDAPSAT